MSNQEVKWEQVLIFQMGFFSQIKHLMEIDFPPRLIPDTGPENFLINFYNESVCTFAPS